MRFSCYRRSMYTIYVRKGALCLQCSSCDLERGCGQAGRRGGKE
jgi:hypothetical protein